MVFLAFTGRWHANIDWSGAPFTKALEQPTKHRFLCSKHRALATALTTKSFIKQFVCTDVPEPRHDRYIALLCQCQRYIATDGLLHWLGRYDALTR